MAHIFSASCSQRPPCPPHLPNYAAIHQPPQRLVLRLSLVSSHSSGLLLSAAGGHDGSPSDPLSPDFQFDSDVPTIQRPSATGRRASEPEAVRRDAGADLGAACARRVTGDGLRRTRDAELLKSELLGSSVGEKPPSELERGDEAAFSDRNRSERSIDRERRTKTLHPSRGLEYPHRAGMAKTEIPVHRSFGGPTVSSVRRSSRAGRPSYVSRKIVE